jgi:hypothetical protein
MYNGCKIQYVCSIVIGLKSDLTKIRQKMRTEAVARIVNGEAETSSSDRWAIVIVTVSRTVEEINRHLVIECEKPNQNPVEDRTSGACRNPKQNLV